MVFIYIFFSIIQTEEENFAAEQVLLIDFAALHQELQKNLQRDVTNYQKIYSLKQSYIMKII